MSPQPPQNPQAQVIQFPQVPKLFFGLEPVVVLLFGGMLMYTGILILCDVFIKDDSQLFQILAGTAGAFGGAFFTRIKMDGGGRLESTTVAGGNVTQVTAPQGPPPVQPSPPVKP